jgi:hypothetical protein
MSSRYYADWLAYREMREKQLKDQNERNENEVTTSLIVYKDTPFLNRDGDPNESENCRSEDIGRDGLEKVSNESSDLPSDTCKFDAEFESGNLDLVTRILDREFVSSTGQASAPPNTATSTDLNFPSEMLVDQEYDLTLRNDLHTKGNIQWYYFSVTSPSLTNMTTSSPPSSSSHSPSSSATAATATASLSQLKYPLRIRLNLINMMKSDALYNYGMKPVIYSEYSAKHDNIGWRHWKTEQICYYKNLKTYLQINSKGMKKNQKIKKKKSSSSSSSSSSNYYTLSFVYTFYREDTVYFAHSIPYTYSHLQQFLYGLELKYSQFNSIFNRKLLCHSLCHNRCDLILILSFEIQKVNVRRVLSRN